MSRLARVLLVIDLVIIAPIAYSAWSIYAFSSNSSTMPADAAIVLGAAAWGDQPSPVFRERINHAITLYQQGLVGKIIFTGGQGNSDEPPEAIVAKQYAIQHGVAQADILTETQSRTTQQNLYYARQLAQANHLTSFLIVSDPMHMKRAMIIAQDLGMEVRPAPTPTSRYQSTNSQLRFLARETWFYITYLLGRPFDPLLKAS